MSAHRLYCFAPQRPVVVDFLQGLGVVISDDTPHDIRNADELAELNHILFVVVDHHPSHIPQRMWEVLIRRGALVIHIDDQYERESDCAQGRRVEVHHYAAEARAP